MFGDPSYEWVESGSNAGSAATAHSLYGAYTPFANLNEDDVVLLDVLTLNNDASLLPSVETANELGMHLPTGASNYRSLRPMRVGDASQLHFKNQAAAANASVVWVVWRRKN